MGLRHWKQLECYMVHLANATRRSRRRANLIVMVIIAAETAGQTAGKCRGWLCTCMVLQVAWWHGGVGLNEIPKAPTACGSRWFLVLVVEWRKCPCVVVSPAYHPTSLSSRSGHPSAASHRVFPLTCLSVNHDPVTSFPRAARTLGLLLRASDAAVNISITFPDDRRFSVSYQRSHRRHHIPACNNPY